MANTYDLYTGNGTTSLFNITWPYISEDDINVKVNSRVLLASEWDLETATSVRIVDVNGNPDPPGSGDAIEIFRTTEQSTRLVDYQPGSVLTEADLNLASKQNFYLVQEANENYAKLVDDALARVASDLGVTDLDGNGLIDETVAGILTLEAAAEIQQRITDIDTNATLINATSFDVSLLGASNVALDAFVMDASAIYIDTDGGTTLSTHVTSITTHTGQFARTTASALNTAVVNAEGDIVSLEAHYGVTLNVNDYITGFTLLNDGQTGTFDILTDKFRIVDPASGGQNPVFPFAVQGGNVYAQNMVVGQGIIVGGHHGMALNGDPLFADIGATGLWQSKGADVIDDADVTQTLQGAVSGAPAGGNKLTRVNNDNTLDRLDSETVQIDPNKTYRVSVWAKQPSGDRVNWLFCNFYDDAGATILGSTSGATGWDGLGTFFYWDIVGAVIASSWTRYEFTLGPSGTGSIPATAMAVKIGGYFCATGTTNTTVELMDMRIEEVLGSVLIQDGAITADKVTVTDLSAINADMGSITAGSIVLPSGGFIRSGMTAYNTGTGFYLGNDSGTPKFSIGNSSGNKLTWDGTTLSVFGTIQRPDAFEFTNSVGTFIGQKATMTAPTTGDTTTWVEIDSFTLQGTGTFTLGYDAILTNGTTPSTSSNNGQVRIKVNGVVKATGGVSEVTWNGTTNNTLSNISVTDPAHVVSIEATNGLIDGIPEETKLDNVEVRAIVSHIDWA